MAGIFNLDYPAALMEIYREINGYKAYCNNYKYSTIRVYLNGKYENGDRSTTHDYEERGFLQTAFSSTAQEKIATTIVDNSADSTTDETGDIPKADGTTLSSDAEYYPDFTGSPTEDKIFLLSIKDVTTTAYGFSYYKDKDSARARNGTDYARANHFNDRTPGGTWFLRTPCYDSKHMVLGVDTDGDANKCSHDGLSVMKISHSC